MKPDKKKIVEKWKPIIDNLGVDSEDKKEWISQYAEMHQASENLISSGNTVSEDFNLLPISMKIASKTIGLDLSAPTGKLFIDGETPDQKAERIRKEREKKLKRILGDDYEGDI